MDCNMICMNVPCLCSTLWTRHDRLSPIRSVRASLGVLFHLLNWLHGYSELLTHQTKMINFCRSFWLTRCVTSWSSWIIGLLSAYHRDPGPFLSNAMEWHVLVLGIAGCYKLFHILPFESCSLLGSHLFPTMEIEASKAEEYLLIKKQRCNYALEEGQLIQNSSL